MDKVIAHQKLPTEWSEREILREKGQFWTPSWVAEAMVTYVSEKTDLIFDPATGRGAFLEALTKLNRNDIAFYGTDIDNVVLSDDIYNTRNCIVENRDFLKNPPKRKFKAIVANPPYIRHHRIDEETKNHLKLLSSRITGEKIDGRAGYHIYFLIQALSLLEINGKLAFIVPADTCEGKFSKLLWKWISKNFCIECVVTFDEKATPFPGVDTNAIVLFIRNSLPKSKLFWIKSNRAYSQDLINYVSSDFINSNYNSLEIFDRFLAEAISTGLSRAPQNANGFQYHLNDFAKVMRGIATGSNEFFFLTKQQAIDLKIPNEFLKRAIGRTKDINGDIITSEDIANLEKENRPTYLFSVGLNDKLPESVIKYIKKGENLGLNELALIKQRKPWYKMEKREIPLILFAYLGRKSIRFIKNDAKVIPLTCFLCVYPSYDDDEYVNNLWQALNDPDTIENLKLVGKSYGSGAIKVEPGNLNLLPIPDHIVKKYDLKKRPYKSITGQLELLREANSKYKSRSK